MTYSNGSYVDVGKLTSTPDIIKISDGDSFDQISEEYTDARSFDAVINSASWNGTTMTLDAINYNQFGYLRQKYGLWDIDSRETLVNRRDTRLPVSRWACSRDCPGHTVPGRASGDRFCRCGCLQGMPFPRANHVLSRYVIPRNANPMAQIRKNLR